MSVSCAGILDVFLAQYEYQSQQQERINYACADNARAYIIVNHHILLCCIVLVSMTVAQHAGVCTLMI